MKRLEANAVLIVCHIAILSTLEVVHVERA